MDFMGWRCFSQPPFSVYRPPLRLPRRAPAPLLQYLASKSCWCAAPPPPTEAQKLSRGGRDKGCSPGCTQPGVRSLPGPCPWCRGCGPGEEGARAGPAELSPAAAPARPLGRAGRWGMCRLGAGLAHPQRRRWETGREGAAGETGGGTSR